MNASLAYQKKMRQLLLIIKAEKLKTAKQIAMEKGCHINSIERLLRKLRKEGHRIIYDRTLKRYVLEED